MSNFEHLEHYIIPSDLLILMLDAYKEIGKTDIYIEKLDDYATNLEEKTLNEDTFYLAQLIGLDITDSRMNLLLNKDLNSRNKEEEVLKKIKKTLKLIKIDAKRYSLNPGELINYLNNIYGKHKFNYSNKSISLIEKKHVYKKSIRMLINESFDEYELYNKLNRFEKNFLSIILFLDIINLQPFTDKNDLASWLFLYYSMHQNNINVFKYVSFFKTVFDDYNLFQDEIKKASINYNDGFVQASGLSKLIFKTIIEAFKALSNEAKQSEYTNKGLKTDNVESSIFKLPEFFTKDDVREANPNVSDATINRVLNKLKEEGYIMPLGTGRSAKWRKNSENINIPLSKIVGE